MKRFILRTDSIVPNGAEEAGEEEEDEQEQKIKQSKFGHMRRSSIRF